MLSGKALQKIVKRKKKRIAMHLLPWVIILEGKEIIIYYDGEKIPLANVSAIPLTDNGRDAFMAENVLAACAAVHGGTWIKGNT